MVVYVKYFWYQVDKCSDPTFILQHQTNPEQSEVFTAFQWLCYVQQSCEIQAMESGTWEVAALMQLSLLIKILKIITSAQV